MMAVRTRGWRCFGAVRVGLALACGGMGGCTTHMTPGTVRAQDDDPIVTVEAGNIRVGSGQLFVRYVIDRATQTCWLMGYDSLAPLPCCAARRATGVAEFITWESDASCDASGTTPATVP